MSGFTIVVKGEDGRGRTQMAEVIRLALIEKGFSDVAVVPIDKADYSQQPTPFRDTPIIIAEG